MIHGGGWVSGDKSDFYGPLIDTLKSRVPDYAIFNHQLPFGRIACYQHCSLRRNWM